MKSIFRYPGGKSKKAVYSWILSHKPNNVRHYRESMVGGGGVFFNMDEGRVWINDLNEGLIEVYTALRDRPGEFIKLCRSIKPAQDNDPMTEVGPRGGAPKNKRMFDLFEELKLNIECDQALRYYYVNRTCYAGRVNYAIPSRLYFSNPQGWNITKTDLLEQAAAKLQGAKITCDGYEATLKGRQKDVWVYIDPPYVVNTDMPPTDQLYEHNFTLEQHQKLAADIRASNHRVAISYDDDPEGIVRELYRGFRIEEATWKYCGSSLPTKREGQELLILNY